MPQPGWPWTPDPDPLSEELEHTAARAAEGEQRSAAVATTHGSRRKTVLAAQSFGRQTALLVVVFLVLTGAVAIGIWRGYLKDQRTTHATQCHYAQLTGGGATGGC